MPAGPILCGDQPDPHIGAGQPREGGSGLPSELASVTAICRLPRLSVGDCRLPARRADRSLRQEPL